MLHVTQLGQAKQTDEALKLGKRVIRGAPQFVEGSLA